MRCMETMKLLLILNTMRLSKGYLPPRVLGLVTEWTALHQIELMENWESARNQEPLKNVDPLV